MEDEKEIRFTQKKVDDSWKQAVESDKDKQSPAASESPTGSLSPLSFSDFITSLGVQALAHMGEIENPATGQKTKNLEAAHEMIDLLILLKEKTKGNLTPDENVLLANLLSELQIRYVENAR